MINGWMVAGALAAGIVLSGLAGWQGYSMGKAKCEADHNEEKLQLIAESKESDRARIAAEVARDDMARQLDQVSVSDPVLVHRCLSPSRVRRLNLLHQDR